MNKLSILALQALLLAGIGIGRVYAESSSDAGSQAATGATTATGQAAGRVFIDPETGELGGPPAGVEPPGLSVAIQKKLSRSDQGLEAQRLTDGTLLMNLQGRFQNMSAATLDAQGEAHLNCADSVEGMETALAHGVETTNAQQDGKP